MQRTGLRNQTELAERLGLTQGAVSAWNSGNRTPPYETCAQLLAMGMTIEELFGSEIAGIVRNGDKKQPKISEDEIFSLVKKALAKLGSE